MLNFLDALKMTLNAALVQNYAVLMLAVYLTDVWGLGITHAAGLINIWVGLTKIMPLFFLFLIDNYFGSYSMLVISTTASALGMWLLSISTPSWLYSLITGSCSEYKMKCISETQQCFFYFALVLIMIGRSACDAALETIDFKGDANIQGLVLEFLTSGTGFITFLASRLVLTPWSIIFGVSSVCSAMALLLLMDKSWSHKLYINNPKRSPLTSVLRVSMASMIKIPQKIKRDDSLSFNRSSFSIQEVEDAKTLVRMLPVGFMVAFLVLISTIGSTYFLQQVKRLKPIAFFGFEVINIYSIAWFLLTERIRSKFKYNNTYTKKDIVHRLVIEAMINAMICCVAAALVEKSRLGVIRKHDLANKPGEIIPMSSFWMLPQIFMLSQLNASLDQIIRKFFPEDMLLPMKNFKVFVLDGFIGVGIMSSVLVVHLVGKISEMGGRPNWFQYDTENSRLDLFYWTLTALCVMAFIWFQVSIYFNSRWYPKSRQWRVNI